MGNYNWFGATPQDVIRRYSNGSYVPLPSEFGGLQAIEAVMDLCESALEAALGPEVFRQLINPKLLCVVPRAFTGQTAFQIPPAFLPIVPASMSLWYGSPIMFQLEPRKRSEVGTSWGTNSAYMGAATWDDSAWSGGNYHLFELQIDQFSWDTNTGAGQILSPVAPMSQDQVVYVSFDVNFSDPTYGQKAVNPMNNKSLLSLATCLIDGASAILGTQIYSQGMQVWDFVSTMAKRWEHALEQYGRQERIVSELRLCRWWTPLEKTTENDCVSRRAYRS
jgi:hypothetical protein